MTDETLLRILLAGIVVSLAIAGLVQTWLQKRRNAETDQMLRTGMQSAKRRGWL